MKLYHSEKPLVFDIWPQLRNRIPEISATFTKKQNIIQKNWKIFQICINNLIIIWYYLVGYNCEHKTVNHQKHVFNKKPIQN